MAAASTRDMLQARFAQNDLLRAASYAPMPESGDDLSGEHPTRPPDPSMIAGAAEALAQGQTHYVDVPGIAPLREALAGLLAASGVEAYAPGQLLVTAGVQEARFLSIQMIGRLYSGLAVPSVVHPGVAAACGTRPLAIERLPVDESAGMLVPTEAIRAALERGRRLVYLESPTRLTGAAYNAADVAIIAELLAAFDAAAIWDQGLSAWLAPGRYRSLGATPGMQGRVALIGEAWPGLGLESWQVGYLAAPDPWMEDIRAQKQIMAICTSTAAQYAALRAPDVYARLHDAQTEELLQLRQEAADLAQQYGLVPLAGAAATVLAMRIPAVSRARERLRAAGFGCADGGDFGAPQVIRLAVTPSNRISAALKVLTQT